MADELVSVRVEVKRGDKVLMVLGVPLDRPSGWVSPGPDHDIITQNGPLCEILCMAHTRNQYYQRDSGEVDPPECEEDEEIPF